MKVNVLVFLVQTLLLSLIILM